MQDSDSLLDIKQAAKVLGVTEASLRRWTNSGRLACVRVGANRERRFRHADLKAFMEEQPARHAVNGGPAAESASGIVVGGLALAAGTHFGSLYSSDAGRTKLAVGFLVDGLVQGSACHLVASPAATQEVLAQLESRVPRVQDDIDQGRLVLYDYRGSSSAHLEYAEARLIASLRAGARSVRLVGNVSESAFARSKSIDYLVRYEQDFARLLAKRFPLVSLCQYDARRYSGVDVCRLLNCHHDDFRYPPERLLF